MKETGSTQKQRKQLVSDKLFRINPVQQVKPDSIKKENPLYRVLLCVSVREVLATHKNYF